MSAAVAAPNGAAMSNAETAIMPSEVRFMVSPSEGSSLFVCAIFAPFAVARQVEVGFLCRFSAPCCDRGTVCSAVSRPDRSMCLVAVPRQLNEVKFREA
jgi:hypothetical protein